MLILDIFVRYNLWILEVLILCCTRAEAVNITGFLVILTMATRWEGCIIFLLLVRMQRQVILIR